MDAYDQRAAALRRASIVDYSRGIWQKTPLSLVVFFVLVGVSIGAQHRTANFVVETPDPTFSQQVAQAAERFRHDLAVEWVGEPMPNWAKPCRLTVQVAPNLGAGGATTFIFDHGEVFGWRMSIQGPADRILDSVLPHEITHMIFACHFRQPLPRWADEGGATSVEHVSEQNKYRQMLIQCLHNNRGIAFNQMFAMMEYPSDYMALYAQGYSLADYLIQIRGRRKYVEFLDDGMKTDDWSGAAERCYGLKDLGVVQNTWLSWVRQGMPRLPQQESPVQLASADRRPRPEPNLLYRVRNQPTQTALMPTQPTSPPPAPAASSATSTSDEGKRLVPIHFPDEEPIAANVAK